MLQVRLRVDTARALVVSQRVTPHVQGVQVGRRTSTQAAEGALQRVLKRLPEVPIEVSVDERVQRWVEVADPEEESDDDVRAEAGFAAERRDDVPRTSATSGVSGRRCDCLSCEQYECNF